MSEKILLERKKALSAKLEEYNKKYQNIQAELTDENCNFVSYSKAFVDSVETYKENYMLRQHFNAVTKSFDNLSIKVGNIFYQLFDYREAKQAQIYIWAQSLMQLLFKAKVVLDETYNLAYIVGRNDPVTIKAVDAKTFPIHKLPHEIVSSKEFQVYSCPDKSPLVNSEQFFIERDYLAQIEKLCGEFQESVATSCDNTAFRNVNTPVICTLNSKFQSLKIRIDEMKPVSLELKSEYLKLWAEFFKTLVSILFRNFVAFFNKRIMQKIYIFVAQQHQFAYNLYRELEKEIALRDADTMRKQTVGGILFSKSIVENDKNCTSTCGRPTMYKS